MDAQTLTHTAYNTHPAICCQVNERFCCFHDFLDVLCNSESITKGLDLHMTFFLHTSFSFSWRRQWHPTPILLLGKSHGRRSLVGCSPWGRQESDTTERLHLHLSLSCTGEGNGNPLQYSCLEHPRDGGAWWAAIYGVTQSRTHLKRISSSSSLAFHKLLFF